MVCLPLVPLLSSLFSRLLLRDGGVPLVCPYAVVCLPLVCVSLGELLVERGADRTLRNLHERAPIDEARALENRAIISVLMPPKA